MLQQRELLEQAGSGAEKILELSGDKLLTGIETYTIDGKEATDDEPWETDPDDGFWGESLIPREILESRKLRNTIKKEFMNSSKSNKDDKLREAIKKILRKKKK